MGRGKRPDAEIAAERFLGANELVNSGSQLAQEILTDAVETLPIAGASTWPSQS
jgi:hypothetical protein